MKITAKIPTTKSSRIHGIGKINAGTTLAKIVEKKGAAEVLNENGVPCLSCPMAPFEMSDLKIGEVCKTYGLNLKEILKDLNK